MPFAHTKASFANPLTYLDLCWRSPSLWPAFSVFLHILATKLELHWPSPAWPYPLASVLMHPQRAHTTVKLTMQNQATSQPAPLVSSLCHLLETDSQLSLDSQRPGRVTLSHTPSCLF